MSAFLTAKMEALAPRLVTRREIIRGVAARWRDGYPDDRYKTVKSTAGEIRLALEALDPETATREDIAAIIGNDSWTELKCEVCEVDRDAVVRVPREYDGTIDVCQVCAKGIAQMFADGQQ